MKISLGTVSVQKTKYLQAVLRELRIKTSKIILQKVESGVAEQPLTSVSTKRGSINRAKRAFALDKTVDFSLGIEVGYNLNSLKQYEILCWVTVYDGRKTYSCQSNRFPLPKYYQDNLRANRYLGHCVRKLRDNKDSVRNKLWLILKNRDFIIKNAIFHVLVYFLNKKEY